MKTSYHGRSYPKDLSAFNLIHIRPRYFLYWQIYSILIWNLDESVVFLTDWSYFCRVPLYPSIPYYVTKFHTFEAATRSERLPSRFPQSSWNLVKTAGSFPVLWRRISSYREASRKWRVFNVVDTFRFLRAPMVIIFMADGCFRSW